MRFGLFAETTVILRSGKQRSVCFATARFGALLATKNKAAKMVADQKEKESDSTDAPKEIFKDVTYYVVGDVSTEVSEIFT
jgi:hypothetical protein